MKKLLFTLTITAFLLFIWQVFRFLNKTDALEKTKNCIVDFKNIEDSTFCNGDFINFEIQSKAFFLFKDTKSSQLLVVVQNAGKYFLVNLGYIFNKDKAEVLAKITKLKNLSFSALHVPIKKRWFLFLKNDLKDGMLYDIDPVQISKELKINLPDFILYSTKNQFIEENPDIIFANDIIRIKNLMHLGYAFMWGAIFLSGLCILFCLRMK